MEPLLQIKNLAVDFDGPDGRVHVLEDLCLHIMTGESVGLVGESGCGKSVTALSILNLVASPPGRVTAGSVFFKGEDLLAMSSERLRHIRGKEISMIFQEPLMALNPVIPIGRQVAEPLMAHKKMRKRDAYAAAAHWLARVHLPGAKQRLGDYPYQLSGGMRQRVMIAMAMICQPQLLIADEPTTALDVTIQAQILSLMLTLKKKSGNALLLISHDLGVISQMVDRVVVMYAGQVVEVADVMALFDAPFHPYTHGLLSAMPGFGVESGGGGLLPEIAGTVPTIADMPPGCRFAPRCRHAFDRCHEVLPGLFSVGDAHEARCWLKYFPDQRRHDAAA